MLILCSIEIYSCSPVLFMPKSTEIQRPVHASTSNVKVASPSIRPFYLFIRVAVMVGAPKLVSFIIREPPTFSALPKTILPVWDPWKANEAIASSGLTVNRGWERPCGARSHPSLPVFFPILLPLHYLPPPPPVPHSAQLVTRLEAFEALWT